MSLRSLKWGIPLSILCWIVIIAALLAYCEDTEAFTKGDSIRASWTAPTQEEQGRDIQPGEILGYLLSWSCDASGSGDVFTQATFLILPDDLLGNCLLSIVAQNEKGFSTTPYTLQLLIKLPAPTGGFR